MRGYAAAHARLDAEQRFVDASTMRVAMWGSPDDLNRLRPVRRAGPGQPHDDDDDDDETGLAQELAALGFYEVKAD